MSSGTGKCTRSNGLAGNIGRRTTDCARWPTGHGHDGLKWTDQGHGKGEMKVGRGRGEEREGGRQRERSFDGREGAKGVSMPSSESKRTGRIS
eukprot:scaffold72150_cov26-Tisochrysis_lutea.AAC.1